MRQALRLVLALAILAGYAVAALGDDLRFRSRSNWIPGFFEGRYSGESDIAALPDVIVATIEYRGAERTVLSLVPTRTLEKR